MREFLTTRQVAQALGVSDASLKRWCDKGLIEVRRTGGGHRRLPLGSVLAFLRRQGYPLLRPELLGLPPRITASGEPAVERAIDGMRLALEAGDDELFRRTGYNLLLGGLRVVEICDRVLVPVFHALGSRWQHGEIEVYQERRGCEICLRWLHELRFAVTPPAPDAPRAIGATLAGDLYWIPSTMVELVLREAGWRAESLGIGLPGETMAAAVTDQQPRLVWVSVSHIEGEHDFLQHYRHVEAAARRHDVPVVVGGRALDEPLRRCMNHSAFGDSFQHVVNFARTIFSAARLHDADAPVPSENSQDPAGDVSY